MKAIVKSLGIITLIAATAGGAWYFTRPDPQANPIVANETASVTVLPFASLNSVDDLPAGWTHQTFWTKPAMELSLENTEETQTIRCETNGGGSIFSRSTDIALLDFPYLEWDWRVEAPITSDIDEVTEEGDDHPARLFLQFRDETRERRTFEIIWSNQKFTPGDYKYIGDFAHYVANGLAANVGVWHHERVNILNIYRKIFESSEAPVLISIGIFCDSDNTGGHSIAYFGDVVLHND